MFWIGLILGAAITVGVFFLLQSKVKVQWWQWLLMALTIVALFAAFQHLFSSISEHEVKAAWLGFAMFGGIAIILGALTTVFITRNNSKEA